MPKIHGTASWTQPTKDLSFAFNAKRGASGRVLGSNGLVLGLLKPGSYTGQHWNTSIEQGHGICFGPNRTGKGASVIIPALLTYAGSMFVIDPKGEAAWVTAERRRAMGQRVVLLDPFNEVNRAFAAGKTVERPTKFNPLRFLDPLSRSFTEDVGTVAEALIVKSANDHNVHFTESANEMIAGSVAILKEKFGDEATIPMVRRIIQRRDEMQALVEDMRENNPDSLGVTKLARFTDAKPDNNEVNGVFAAASTQTRFLDSADMSDSLEDDETPFSMSEFTQRPTTMYVVLPPNLLSQQARWMRLILLLVLREVTRVAQAPKVPTMLVVDEMGTIGPLRQLEDSFALLAGYGVRFFGFLQQVQQLERDYPNSWEVFTGNCSWIQCLGARDKRTSEYISDLLGRTTIATMGSSGSGDPYAFGAKTYSENRQEGMPLMDAQQVREQLGKFPDKLDQNLQVVIGQGGVNMKLYQNPYFKNPAWAGWYRQNTLQTKR
jgi:type IV secretion system protein VirD4